jgi:hypothetical protein
VIDTCGNPISESAYEEGMRKSLRRDASKRGLVRVTDGSGFVAGRASASSSVTKRKKVVLHCVHRDVPAGRRRRVILLRRQPPAR